MQDSSMRNRGFISFYKDISSREYLNQFVSSIEKDGIVTFDQVYSTDRFMDLANSLGIIVKHRDSDDRGLTRIAVMDGLSKKEGFAGFSEDELILHTDRSGLEKPPNLLMFLCYKPAIQGGDSLFLDCKELYRKLDIYFPDILEKITLPRSAIFFGADEPYIGSIFTRLPDGKVKVRFRYDRLGYYSAPVVAIFPELLKIMNECSFSFTLKEGQGYIINNSRLLHGRTSFVGNREMYRVFVEPVPNSFISQQVGDGFIP